jgi:ATP-dependent Clp protease ATP-binding subunit ClpB
MRQAVLSDLKQHFRPEFLNRIDETVIFHRLSRSDLRGIVDRQIALLQQRLANATAGLSGFPTSATTRTATGAEAPMDQAGTGVSPVAAAAPAIENRESPIANALTLELTDAAKDQLAADGYDPVYGARPLKRLIQQRIENPLAKRILAGEFAPGDHIVADSAASGFSFTVAAGRPA